MFGYYKKNLLKWKRYFKQNCLQLLLERTEGVCGMHGKRQIVPEAWSSYSIKYHLNFSGRRPATLPLMSESCLYRCPSLSIDSGGYLSRYSFMNTADWTGTISSENTCPRFHTAAHDSNPGSLNRESEAIRLSHYAIQYVWTNCSRTYVCDKGFLWRITMFTSQTTSSKGGWHTVPVITFTY